MSDSLWPHGPEPSRLLSPWAFSRQEHWSGLPCPPSGHIPDPGLKPCLLCLLCWQMGPSPLAPHGKPKCQLPVFIWETEKTDVQHKSLWNTENTSSLKMGVLETTAWLCINIFWFDSPQECLKIWLASWIVIFFNMTFTNISYLFLLEIEKEYLETKIWNSNIGNTKKLSLLDFNSEYRNKCLYAQK